MSIPPSIPWDRCDAPPRSRAAGDSQARGTVWAPPLSPSPFTMRVFVPDFGSSSPEQCERWDRPADNRWATANAKCCSATVQGSARRGTRGGGSTASSPQCSLLHLPPQGWFFPGYLLPTTQSPQQPAQASPLPRIRRSLIPRPGHQRAQSCGGHQDTVTRIWGSYCFPLGWTRWEGPGQGEATLCPAR